MQLKQANGFFVTGTGTGVGKTFVTQLLIRKLKAVGYKAIGCKPVACGFDADGNNEDVLAYQAVNSIALTNQQINPLAFALPASPNLAAQAENKSISLDNLTTSLKTLCTLPIDFVFFEGVGGWKVPLSDDKTMVDLAKNLNVPIIFVVGIQVGCINHALLTWDSLVKENIKCAGWIASVIDPNTPTIEGHIDCLSQRIPAPLLGIVPFQGSDNSPEDTVNITLLIN